MTTTRTAKRTRMKTVYIAFAYLKDDNVDAAKESMLIAKTLLDIGYAPFLPLLYHSMHLISDQKEELWRAADLAWLLRCDCVFRIDCISSDAAREVELAIENKIPVVYSIEQLQREVPV